MPLGLPYIAPGDGQQWIRIRLTATDGFDYDLSNLATSVDISRGRSDALQTSIPAGTCSVSFDDTLGILDPDNSLSPCAGYLDPAGTSTLRVEHYSPDLGYWVQLFTGLIESLERTFTGGTYSQTQGEFSDQVAELSRHVPTTGTVLPAQLPGDRIYQLLTSGSRSGYAWVSRSVTDPKMILETGQKILGRMVLDGTTGTWDLAQAAAQAELGLLYFDGYGTLVFEGQQHRLDNTVTWTLGDQPGMTPVETDLTYRISTDDLIQDAAVTTTDKITSISGVGGRRKYADAVNAPTTDLTDSSQLGSWHAGAAKAAHLYRTRATPRRNAPTMTLNIGAAFGRWVTGGTATASYPSTTRYPSLTTFPGGSGGGGAPTAYQVGLQVKISDLLRTVQTPAYGSQIDALYRVEGFRHSIAAGTGWTLSLNVSRADLPPASGYWELGKTALGDRVPLTW